MNKDRMGVAACIHSLLFFEEMKIVHESRIKARRRGFQLQDLDHTSTIATTTTTTSMLSCHLSVPKVTLKR